MNCPICGSKPRYTQKTITQDSMCSNGHVWHICAVHGEIVPTLNYKNEEYSKTICTCGRE